MHAIVIGGAGFVGHHLVRVLFHEGHQVTVVDNFSTGDKDKLAGLAELSWVEQSVQTCSSHQIAAPVDVIFHLAANASVQASWHQPLQAHDDNLTAVLSVAQLAQNLQVKRVVYASSAAVYGIPQILPIDENHPQNAISPYGYQKLWGEKYLRLFGQQAGFSVVGLRLFNVFGPGQNPSSHYSGVITLFANAMRAGADISVYGDGKQSRDFVYVEDVARAFIQAGRLDLEMGQTRIFNVGTGQPTDLLELIEVLKPLNPEWKGQVVFKDPLPGDIRDSVADVSAAAEALGFEAKESLQAGLAQLLKG